MNTMTASTLAGRRLQGGAVLIVSLLLLLVLTILAIGASQTTRIEERMAWNSRDTDLAFQGAEAGLRSAEKYISVTTALPTCTNPASSTCYVLQQGHFAATDLARQIDPWWVANGKAFGTAATQEVVGVKRGAALRHRGIPDGDVQPDCRSSARRRARPTTRALPGRRAAPTRRMPWLKACSPANNRTHPDQIRTWDESS